jgi:hypothetical protein
MEKKPRIIGREEEFLIKPVLESEKRFYAILRDFLKEKWSGVLSNGKIDYLHDNTRWIRTGGIFYGADHYIESSTAPIEIERGCFEKMTDVTLAQRIILIDFFENYNSKFKKSDEKSKQISGDNSHENIRIKSLNDHKCNADYQFEKKLDELSARTIVPILICFYKNKNSKCNLGYTAKEEDRLQVYCEYLPNPDQLTAANAFLVSSIRILEDIIRAEPDKEIIIFRNKFPFFIQDNESDIDGFAFDRYGEDIRVKGLDTKIKLMHNNHTTIREMLKEWIKHFGDYFAKNLNEKELELLKSYTAKSARLDIDREGTPNYYKHINSGYLRYLEKKCRADPFVFAKNVIKNSSGIRKEFSEAVLKERKIGIQSKSITIKTDELTWQSNTYHIKIKNAKNGRKIEVPLGSLKEFNELIAQSQLNLQNKKEEDISSEEIAGIYKKLCSFHQSSEKS